MYFRILFFLTLFHQTTKVFCEEIDISTITQSNQISQTIKSNQEIEDLLNLIKEEIYYIENSTESITNIKIILNDARNKILTLKEKGKLNKKEEDFRKAILKIRKALLNSFIKTNRYPKQLEELEDTFIDFIPQINIHGEFNSRIKYVSKEFDRDYTKAVDNTTEYIYFSDPQSKYWGLFLINSNKKFEEKHYYEY